ncbi:MAG TPA: hypothetical protein VFF46_05180, partial [Kribbella sp.]|nr:hypothetical protein [Kribbella sp.]
MPLVDLDDPEELRARWTALAAVAHATGFDRRWYADADGYHHQDETGSVLHMVRLGDGRAVLFGFHTHHSQTARTDLLAGSPDWIAQPEVRRRATAGELGFVYGAFNATWARASYPGDPWQPVDDGFGQIGQWITSDEATADEMIEWVAEWSDYLGGLDELRPYGVALIEAARGPALPADALAAFFAPFGIDPRSPVQPDLPAGVAAAADFTQNFAEPASFPEAPDAAEVSVVEPHVTGDNQLLDDEESYVVPPGISPFTGQPLPADDATQKKQGWLRRRKQDPPPTGEPAGPPAEPLPAPSTGPSAASPAGPPGASIPGQSAAPPAGPPAAPLAGPFAAGPPQYDPAAPGTYIPSDTPSSGLPIRHTPPDAGYTLPSSEPPRVGGGQYEGDDFYNSLFADAPAAATPAPDQDWETTEQPSWPDQDPTSAYTPFTDDTPAPEWSGPRWVNGEWQGNPPHQPPQSNEPPTGSPFAPSALPAAQAPDTPHAGAAHEPTTTSADETPTGSPFAPSAYAGT